MLASKLCSTLQAACPQVLMARLAKPDCQARGWLLDGFPHTAAQAQELAAAGVVPDKVLLLTASHEVLLDRAKHRWAAGCSSPVHLRQPGQLRLHSRRANYSGPAPEPASQRCLPDHPATWLGFVLKSQPLHRPTLLAPRRRIDYLTRKVYHIAGPGARSEAIQPLGPDGKPDAQAAARLEVRHDDSQENVARRLKLWDEVRGSRGPGLPKRCNWARPTLLQLPLANRAAAAPVEPIMLKRCHRLPAERGGADGVLRGRVAARAGGLRAAVCDGGGGPRVH
jgi:adenylate kinase family enzyme